MTPDNDKPGYKNNPTVWLVNKAGYHDYSAAEKYGDLKPITKNRVNIRNSDRLEAIIQDALLDASPDDYLLLSGHALINVLAVTFLYKRFGEVKVLYWDQMFKDYHLRELDFGTKRLET